VNPADTAGKITAFRLRRDAYLHIRQSTLYQVANNTESTTRQYDLRGRAITLGWPAERIHVIDIDQGHSGASAADREGFQIVPDYVCQNDGIRNAQPICQHLSGVPIDAAVASLLLATLTPLALEVALTVSDELIHNAEHADSLRAAHVQRAADQARRRYLAVDPGNRLVADTLEADWNAALRELAAAHDDYTAAKTAAVALDASQRARIHALAADFPALWNNPATPSREPKRLIRLLVTDVTLTRGQHAITAAVRFPGGQSGMPRALRSVSRYRLR
jgi:hypothetical protein